VRAVAFVVELKRVLLPLLLCCRVALAGAGDAAVSLREAAAAASALLSAACAASG
jgi:hypothetical protein